MLNPLPHAYPFRFVDRRDDGSVVVRLTAGSPWSRGGLAYPSALGVEILAQAAILSLPRDPAGGEGRGLLAGVDGFELQRPLTPGETLEAQVELLGRFGRLLKIHGRLLDEAGETLAESGLLLAQDG